MAADVIDAPYPWASFSVAVIAAATAGLILAPLDLVRTKLILTPTTTPKRSLANYLRTLPSYLCPLTLTIPTVLHSLISPALAYSTPLLLRSQLSIDPVLTPTTFSIATFLSSTIELFLKLPLETVLRRGQMFVLASPQYLVQGKNVETIVDIGPYRGVVGTMWSIVYEEGISITGEDTAVGKAGVLATRRTKKTGRKGQGIEGLWRGWRVGMWGLVGMWGAAAMGGASSSGGEF